MTLAPGHHAVPEGHLAMVVTHLEMMAPPPPRPVPATDAVVEAWAPTVAAYRDLFRRVGAPWLWASRLMQSETDVAATLGDPAYETRRLRRGDAELGILDLDFREAGACELAFFGLVPEAVGGGLGRVLMDAALARAFRDGPTRLHVHTCTLDGPAALDFYRRSGFRAVRREVEIMRDPRGAELPADAAPQVPRL